MALMTVNNGFHLYATTDRPFVQNITRHIEIRSTHFGHRFVLSALCLYRVGVNEDAKWFIRERNKELRVVQKGSDLVPKKADHSGQYRKKKVGSKKVKENRMFARMAYKECGP